MVLNMSFKQMDPSNSIKEHVKEKSEKLQKYFDGKISVTWNFSHEKQGRVAHCHLVGNNMDYFGEAVTSDFFASIDQAFDRIEKQLRKHKEIVKAHIHRPGVHRATAT